VSFPINPPQGVIDLGNPESLLHYVNRALHALQLHSDRDGFLAAASSERLLRQKFGELTEAQVREVNDALFTLGLRETKPGGGEHIIRIDVREVTLQQLLANKRLPALPLPAVKNEGELFAAVSLAIEGLREQGERIEGSPYTVALVHDHMQIIESLAGELICEVILALKALDAYRVYKVYGEPVCFVNTIEPGHLTARMVTDGKALVEWPNTVEELLPPTHLAKAIGPEALIRRLVAACEKSAAGQQAVSRQLAQRTTELARVLEAYGHLSRRRLPSSENVMTWQTKSLPWKPG
jgi:hypothetical protein